MPVIKNSTKRNSRGMPRSLQYIIIPILSRNVEEIYNFISTIIIQNNVKTSIFVLGYLEQL